MIIEDYFWPDSQIIKIVVEFNSARIYTWNDLLKQKIVIQCNGLVGMTNLCVWDDTIIKQMHACPVNMQEDLFIQTVLSKYLANYDYGGRSLGNGISELRIILTNDIPFSVYCQEILVKEENEGVFSVDPQD